MKRYFLPLFLATACVGGSISQGWGMQALERRNQDSDRHSSTSKPFRPFFNSQISCPSFCSPQELKKYPSLIGRGTAEENLLPEGDLSKALDLCDQNLNLTEEEKILNFLNNIGEKKDQESTFSTKEDVLEFKKNNDISSIFDFLEKNKNQIYQTGNDNSLKISVFRHRLDAFGALFSIVGQNLSPKLWSDERLKEWINFCDLSGSVFTKLLKANAKKESKGFQIPLIPGRSLKEFLKIQSSLYLQRYFVNKKTLETKSLEQLQTMINLFHSLNGDQHFFSPLTQEFFLYVLNSENFFKKENFETLLMKAVRVLPGDHLINLSYTLLKDPNWKPKILPFLKETIQSEESIKILKEKGQIVGGYFAPFIHGILTDKNFFDTPPKTHEDPCPLSGCTDFLSRDVYLYDFAEEMWKIGFIVDQMGKKEGAFSIYKNLLYRLQKQNERNEKTSQEEVFSETDKFFDEEEEPLSDGEEEETSPISERMVEARLDFLRLTNPESKPEEFEDIFKRFLKNLNLLTPQETQEMQEEMFAAFRLCIKNQNNELIPLFYKLLNDVDLRGPAISFFSKNPLNVPAAIDGENKLCKYLAKLISLKDSEIGKFFDKKKPKDLLLENSQDLVFQMAFILEKLAKNKDELKKALRVYGALAENHTEASIRYDISKLYSNVWSNPKEQRQTLESLEKKLKKSLEEKQKTNSHAEGFWLLSEILRKQVEEQNSGEEILEKGTEYEVQASILGHPEAVAHITKLKKEEDQEALHSPNLQNVLIVDPNHPINTVKQEERKEEEHKEPENDIPDSQTVIGDDEKSEMGNPEDFDDGVSVAPSQKTEWSEITKGSMASFQQADHTLQKNILGTSLKNFVVDSKEKQKQMNTYKKEKDKIWNERVLKKLALAQIVAQQENPVFQKCRDLARSITKDTDAKDVPGILKRIERTTNNPSKKDQEKLGISVTFKKTKSGYQFSCFNAITKKGNKEGVHLEEPTSNLPTSEDNKTTGAHTHHNKSFKTIHIAHYQELNLLLKETFDY